MKNINFINPVPPHRKKEVRFWVWFTFIVVTSAITMIITISFMQWKTYKKIKTENQTLHEQLLNFNSEMDNQHKQMEDKKLLCQQLGKLTKYSKSPKNPSTFFSSLRTLFNANQIQSVSITKNRFELQVLCTNAQQANTYLQKLIPINTIRLARLTALQTQQKQVVATFKGEIT